MDVLELTRQLVAIDSQNPGAYEPEIVRFVDDWARQRGFESRVIELIEGRPNLVITVSRGAGSHLGLSGHLDTKPVGDALSRWNTPPLELTVVGEDAFGLGATDMKGGVAAMMLALEDFASSSGGGTVSLILTADEEQGSDAGAKALVNSGELPALDALVIGEPSGIEQPWEAVHLVSRGICCFEVDVYTQQGHSGLSPLLGRNAMLVAADLLHAFESFEPTVVTPSTIPCSPTVNPGVFIEGGVSYGTWPGRCTVGMEIRLVPGMEQQVLHEEIDRLIATTLRGRGDYEIRYRQNAQGWMPAVDLPIDSSVALAAINSATEVLGREVPVAAFPGGTDATYFIGTAGIPTVTSLGPGWISVAHGANEKVGIAQLDEAVMIYRKLMDHYFDLNDPTAERDSSS